MMLLPAAAVVCAIQAWVAALLGAWDPQWGAWALDVAVGVDGVGVADVGAVGWRDQALAVVAVPIWRSDRVLQVAAAAAAAAAGPADW